MTSDSGQNLVESQPVAAGRKSQSKYEGCEGVPKPLSLLTKGNWRGSFPYVLYCPGLLVLPFFFFSHSTDDINTNVVLKGTFCFRIKQKALNSSRVKILASFGPATNTGPLIPWGPLGVILNLAYLLKFMPANFSN